MAGDHQKDAFGRMNPFQQVPVLVLDDGTAISETIAICRYFEEMQPEPPLFGASPLEGPRTFHVLAEPVPTCDPVTVPGAEDMITLRLRPHETARELANAYVSRHSSIGEMLDSSRSSLRWGQPIPCVVTLQWNRQVPAQPFLELVRLDALSWNR